MIKCPQIYVIYHINERKDKNKMIISIDVEIAFNKINHWFLEKFVIKVAIEGRSMCAQLCSILCNPRLLPPSLPGSSVHGILQARILACVAISSSKGSTQPRDWTRGSCVSCIGRQILYHWATLEAP